MFCQQITQQYMLFSILSLCIITIDKADNWRNKNIYFINLSKAELHDLYWSYRKPESELLCFSRVTRPLHFKERGNKYFQL